MSKEIELTKGYTTIVDDEDYEWLNKYNWCAKIQPNGSVYAFRNPRSGIVLMHRLILGVTEPEVEVDHKNHNTLDNRKSNIRRCTRQENQRNRLANNDSYSKYKGVSSQNGKYRAVITIDGEQYSIGTYDSEAEAAYAYNQLAKKHFGEFAHLNKIPKKIKKKFSKKIYRLHKDKGNLKNKFSRSRPYF